MDYFALKSLHLGAVIASFCLFALRGIWMLADSPWLNRRWVRILPHIVDTVLLASALALAWSIAQYPFVDSWLTAKVLALVAYIVLGSLALKRGRSRAARIASFVAALSVFAYIVSVALTRSPAGWFAVVLH